jgi:diacylglycerol kinase (ATP)
VQSLVVVNPTAGKGRAVHVWRQAQTALDGDYRCVMTEHPGHARELAAGAARDGFLRVIAVGGDGTISEVANGLANTSTELAIIPAGTGDDCAHNLGIPGNPRAAARLSLSGVARPIDLGEIQTSDGTRYFLNIAGLGFDAEAVWRVNHLPSWLALGGTLPYVLGVFQTLGSYWSPPIRLSVGQRTLEKPVFVVAVANGASYAGGMRIAPDALVDDGLLDVCVVGALRRRQVLGLLPKMYLGGHRNHPAVEFWRCTELRAESPAHVRCQADGELVGALPATFKIHPGGLRCVTPPR